MWLFFSSWCQTIPGFGVVCDSLESNCKKSLSNNDCGVNGRMCFPVHYNSLLVRSRMPLLAFNKQFSGGRRSPSEDQCVSHRQALAYSPHLTTVLTQSGDSFKSDPHAAPTVFLHPVAGNTPIMSSSDVIKPVSLLLPTLPSLRCACLLMFSKDSPMTSAPCCRDLYLAKGPEVQV